MAAPVWPEGLPQAFEDAGFAYEYGDNRVRAQTTGGIPRDAVLASQRIDKVAGQMRLSHAQIATLDVFYHDVLAQGVLDFDFPKAAMFGSGVWRVKFDVPPGPVTPFTLGVVMVPIALLILP